MRDCDGRIAPVQIDLVDGRSWARSTRRRGVTVA
jgi:hypothetical protein